MIGFGGVPMRVVVPPRMELKASGMSTLPGSWSRPAGWMATGMSRASAPTLFMKPDSTAASATSADAHGRAGLGRQHHPGERVHRARGLQPAAEHEHAGHRDHGRVTEPGKGLVGRHQPGHHAGEQRTGGHHVVAPPAPEKHGHRGHEDDEDVDLAGRHGRFRGRWSEWELGRARPFARLSAVARTAWLGQCPDFPVPVAVRGVVIHHPHCLHEGVADG